jgi:hypothetical protein
VDAAVLAGGEGIEADARQGPQLVAQHVADRAQLARIGQALAQVEGGRVAAAVRELREVDGDHAEAEQVVLNGGCLLVRRQPDADLAAAGQRRALRLPHGERHDDLAFRDLDALGRFAFDQAQHAPVVVDHFAVFDDLLVQDKIRHSGLPQPVRPPRSAWHRRVP